jgi:hypothetical protein
VRNTRQAFDAAWPSAPVGNMRCDLPLDSRSIFAFASLTQHFLDRVACTPCVQPHVSAVRAEEEYEQNSSADNKSWRAPTLGVWSIDQNVLLLPVAGCTDELGSIHPDLYVWIRGLTAWPSAPVPTLTTALGAVAAEQTYSIAPSDDPATIVVAPVADIAAIRTDTFNPSDYVPFGAGSGAFAFACADLIPFEAAQFDVQVSRRIPWQARIPGAVDASTEPRECTVEVTCDRIGIPDAPVILYARNVAIVHTRGSA